MQSSDYKSYVAHQRSQILSIDRWHDASQRTQSEDTIKDWHKYVEQRESMILTYDEWTDISST